MSYDARLERIEKKLDQVGDAIVAPLKKSS